ncbi:dihydroxyacetone kinase subunit DhaL [Erwiniaceae bacterium BAC15a-03b]|uniref:Dihydroxyacetone kinase subunit DhaL n=1 Tax=Winslowiella arboricola TaxID=2978220 RepID=A0A9J6PW85_9GAMM|nr:dihydroxyacetone kinase subunit DhaL [Winslowiella arboricola]MCU5773222.1 dihydroxyacetone kinase subunit DhaL [Winslowiella arboricola]MCU5779108.1 dihydroxyacetone kinase subunit DhaL [Winslowiella arboricola]
MNASELSRLLRSVARRMIASEAQLTQLDRATGDGDHGVGMERGFSAVEILLSQETGDDIGILLTDVGSTLMSSMGGASGAVFGTLFRAGGKSLHGEMVLTTPLLARFLKNGLEAVSQRGGAKPGDKTVVDALAAAADAAQSLIAEPLCDALPKIAQAARAGSEQTRQMVAAFGRAKALGERAIGHLDPGAASMSLILTFMAEGIKRQEE